MDLLEFIHYVFNVDNEALLQVADPQHTGNAPTEVVHPAPDQKEHATLLRDIHILIQDHKKFKYFLEKQLECFPKEAP